MTDIQIPGGISSLLRPDIQGGRSDPETLRAVAKEVESLFAYELVKVMRESTDQGGLAGDTYSSLFDMEIARVLADRGLGLQDSIVRGLSRLQDEGKGNPEEDGRKPAGSGETGPSGAAGTE